jgi:hypothetical protein
MKKQLLFIALLLTGVASRAQIGSWVTQATGFSTTSTGVRNVSVVDSNTVWISSYDGSGGAANRQDFSMTTDGGATWMAGTTPAPATHDWSMIFGLNDSTAWSMFYNATVGSGGGVWKTTDGGATWTQQGVGTIFNSSSFPDVVHFWNENDGFLMGDPNPSNQFEIYTTTDGGATYTRVQAANIPTPLAGEYGIVGHYTVHGDTVWFDTNKGRVYRSIDKGYNWTVSNTTLVVPANGAIDICFTDYLNGLARLYTAATGVSTMFTTSDGGDTWVSATPLGNFFGSDVKAVPGMNMMVSTGADATNGFTGSSYSIDGGINWVDIELGTQRSALGIADSLTMWAGGFTTSPTDGGIYKYTIIPEITCSDPLINPGTAVGDVTWICEGETLTVSATNVYAPTVGDFAGVSWIISSADITGTTDPLLDPSLIATYTFEFPAPSSSFRQLINDATLIDGTNVPYGTYYWTPVVFGNATANGPTTVFLSDLTLDPNCTFVGNSVPVTVYSPTDPFCANGIGEVKANQLAVYTTQLDASSIDLQLNAATPGNAIVKMYDLTGRVISTQAVAVSKGVNHQTLNVANLATGTYMIRVELNGVTASAKAVKL